MFRPARIRHYLAMMQEQGIAPEAVLAGSSIDAARLDDPRYLVTPDQYRSVIARVLQLAGGTSPAFAFGERSSIADLGIVGYAMVSSATVRQALTLWIRYSLPLVGTCWGVRPVQEDADHSAVEIFEELPTLGGLPFCVEEFIGMTVKIGGVLAGEAPAFRAIEVSYPAPPQAARYREVAQCEPRFGARHTRLVLPRRWVDKALKTSDREFNQICLQNCSQIMRSIAQASPLLSRLRLLLLRSPHAIPSLDEAAAALGLSGRTLRRQLQELDCRYNALVSDFRLELACEYLGAAGLSVKETSYLLGFSSTSAFCRAFKLWTGRTIGEYLEQRGPSGV